MTHLKGLKGLLRNTARALIFVAMAGLAACGRDIAYMKPLAPGESALRSNAQSATLVFGQAGRMTTGRLFTILDEHGKFVGDLPGHSAFAITVPPGRHLFVLMSFDHRKEDILYTDMQAGGVYYVDIIDGNHPLFERRQGYFWPSKRGGDPLYTLSNLGEHLKDATWNQPDVEAGNRYLASRPAETQEAMTDANEARAREEKAPTLATLMHTIAPDDALPP